MRFVPLSLFISAVAGCGHIEVQARIFTSTSSQTGSAEARGLIGKGSMVVSTERL